MKTNSVFRFHKSTTIAFCSLFLFSLTGIGIAQNDKISLEKCYEIGISRTPELQKGLLDILGADVLSNQVKSERLPTLNSMLNHGYNWGQSIDPFTNTFATDRVRTNNLNVRSSWNLFAGFSVKYRIDIAKLNQEYTALLYKANERNYKNEIAAAFAKLQSDHLQKMVKAELVQRSEAFLKNVKALEKSGVNTPYDVLRFQALYENDLAELAFASNEFEYTGFVIKQLLNIQSKDTTAFSFELLDENRLRSFIKIPEPIPSNELPENRMAEVNQQSAILKLKASQSMVYPNLSLNSIIGTGYSGANTDLVNGELITRSYGDQFRENLYQSVVLTLSLPIFNNYSVKRDIELAKIQKRQADWDVVQTQIEINNTLERLNFEFNNELIAIEALRSIRTAQEELFVAAEKMFASGVINFVEFVDARNNATQAQLRYLTSLSRCYGLLLVLKNFSEMNE